MSVIRYGLLVALTLGQIKNSATDPVPTDVKTLASVQATLPPVYKYPLKDGGIIYRAPLADGGTVFVDSSPCAWRAAGSTKCNLIDGGDFGDENTMGPGRWNGAGCVRKSCVKFRGDPEK